jgi:hypothetical protein
MEVLHHINGKQVSGKQMQEQTQNSATFYYLVVLNNGDVSRQ